MSPMLTLSMVNPVTFTTALAKVEQFSVGSVRNHKHIVLFEHKLVNGNPRQSHDR